MANYLIQITIFTPTYNRKKLLRRAFESLQKQTDINFRWLIVDDGSQDGTQEEVEQMTAESKFDITYIYQPNGGKHRAHNTAVKNCSTEYLLILDSDDYLVEDAISNLNSKISFIENKEHIAGIIGNRISCSDGSIIGTAMPAIQYASGNELYQKYGLKGDTLRLYKTSILKKYLFPEIEGEKFVSENVVFDRIDLQYKLLVIKDLLYVGEYQDSGYSNHIYKVHLDNPIGYALSLKSSAESAVTLKMRAGYMILYSMWCKKMGIPTRYSKINDKLLSMLLYPVAFIFMKIKYPAFFFSHFDSQ